MTAVPSAASRRTASNSQSVSGSAPVGSSSTSSLGSRAIAATISTRWRVARSASAISRAGSTDSKRNRERISLARSRIFARLTSPDHPRGSFGQHSLVATSTFPGELSSWYAIPRPAAREACGRPSSSVAPSMLTLPASGVTTPASTFIRVDLPAPFSPRSPCTSPCARERSTPARETPWRAAEPGASGPKSSISTSSTSAAVCARKSRLRRASAQDPQRQNAFGQPSAAPVPSRVILIVTGVPGRAPAAPPVRRGGRGPPPSPHRHPEAVRR